MKSHWVQETNSKCTDTYFLCNYQQKVYGRTSGNIKSRIACTLKNVQERIFFIREHKRYKAHNSSINWFNLKSKDLQFFVHSFDILLFIDTASQY